MPPFTALPQSALATLARRDPGLSQDLWSTLGPCDPGMDDLLRDALGYSDHLVQLAHQVARALDSAPGGDPVTGEPAGARRSVELAELMGWLDRYIWTRLFADGFDPLGRRQGMPNARLLRLPLVAEHIARVFAAAWPDADASPRAGRPGPDAAPR